MKGIKEASLAAYPRRADHVVWKVIEDKGVLLSLDDGSYFELGPVGLSIWERCNGKTPAERIAQSIAREFRVSREWAARDLLAFLRELRKSELIQLNARPASSPRRFPG